MTEDVKPTPQELYRLECAKRGRRLPTADERHTAAMRARDNTLRCPTCKSDCVVYKGRPSRPTRARCVDCEHEWRLAWGTVVRGLPSPEVQGGTASHG